MSNPWNARKFAETAQRLPVGAFGKPRLIWVTAEAMTRALDAWRNGVLDLMTVPLPDEPLLFGLGAGLAPDASLSSWLDIDSLLAVMIAVEPCPGIRGFAARYADDITLIGGLGQTVEDGHVLVPMSREGTELGGVLTSVWGGSLDIGGERTVPIRPTIPPPALGGNPLELAMDQLTALTNALVVILWALINTPTAQSDSAMTVEASTVTLGKKRKRRDMDISMVDIKRAPGVRYAPSGRVIHHDHRWEVIGHWKRQRYGKGNAQVKRIYREPFICGPEDKPLIRKPKVHVLRADKGA